MSRGTALRTSAVNLCGIEIILVLRSVSHFFFVYSPPLQVYARLANKGITAFVLTIVGIRGAQGVLGRFELPSM